MKICSRCNIEKDDSEFRLRYDKKGKGSKQLTYLNNTCKTCDSEISNKHYFKNKNNPEFRQEWLRKSNQYYNNHKEEVKAKMKAYRQTPEYKIMRIEYRKKNREKIFQQEIITKKRYLDKNRNSVSDEYCIHKIRDQKNIERVDITEDMIERKRIEILIKRLRNNIVKIKNENDNNAS
jgi:hypothetical protein